MPTRTGDEWTEFPSKSRFISKITEGFSVQQWVAKEVQVLRIPVDGSPHVIKLKTTEITTSKDRDEETKGDEEWLMHVPDIQGYTDAVFDWDSRSLVASKLRGTLVSEEHEGWWFMYKCNERGAGSLSKKNFAFEGHRKTRAFGDIFIFRLDEEVMCDQLGYASYGELASLPEGKHARFMFAPMAAK
ncbi:hypothetical protein HO133_010839 [Letharia lupina]|uniref:Uncharacterized protein n=1 Tax=Letharia lupina TaxID=560253 RepID=A0A8H6CIS2_9LECA|nr:uncharacterized protein HO133_010839 [Letharia lupina]KAF6224264.1 hypothetical protein HO133_010839 [Letharia lupina]